MLQNIEIRNIQIKTTCDLLKNMSNEVRYNILVYLKAGSLTVMELNKKIPISQSSLSQHLKVLRLSGLVLSRKRGSSVEYVLISEIAEAIIDVVDEHQSNNVAFGRRKEDMNKGVWLNEGQAAEK